MEISKFCPRCGEQVGKLYGGEQKFCGECYLKKNDLLNLSEKVTVETCENCGRIKYREAWEEKESKREKIDYVIGKLGDEETRIGYELKNGDEENLLELEIKKKGLKQEKEVILEFQDNVCRVCENLETDFAKTKLQIRGEKSEEILESVMKRVSNLEEKNFQDFMLGKERTKTGFDIFLSTEHMSQQILDSLKKEFEIDIERSYKKVGVADGEEKYQNTVAVKTNKN